MAAREPWLSIVMPVWNGERYLADALESVRREGTEGYEVIAVDDGSSDGSPEILRAWERLLPLRPLAVPAASRRGGSSPVRRTPDRAELRRCSHPGVRPGSRPARGRHGRVALVHGRLGLVAPARTRRRNPVLRLRARRLSRPCRFADRGSDGPRRSPAAARSGARPAWRACASGGPAGGALFPGVESGPGGGCQRYSGALAAHARSAGPAGTPGLCALSA